MTTTPPPGTRLRFPPGIGREDFLRDYWQQQPLLMPGALAADCFPLDADELAGLACEAEIESRLIIEQTADRWEVRHGPFDEADFATLPTSHWTLLVQDVDKFVPAVAALIERFDFVPDWRIDDVMISFASDQGGVGPHTDAYDVFLMQARGRRRWRLSHGEYDDDDLVPGLEQRILAHFETDQEWVLEPGDVLYLPPGIAHWGIAEGDCMTYSLGFRAPSQRELVADWFQHLVALAGERRLLDPHRDTCEALTEISPQALDGARRLLRELPGVDSAEFPRWFGRHVTEPKPQFQILPPEHAWTADDLDDWIRQGGQLLRHPAARMAWTRTDEHKLTLYCQGRAIPLAADLLGAVNRLCSARRFDAAILSEIVAEQAASRTLLLQLLNDGILERPGDT